MEPSSDREEGDLAASRAGGGPLLAVAAAGLFVLALGGAWTLIVGVENLPQTPPLRFYLGLALTFVPLLLLAAVLVLDARRAEGARLAALYQIRVDQLETRTASREDMVRLIADHQPGAISIFDRHNRYWFVNALAASWIGRPAAQIIGQPPIKVLANEQAKRLEIRLAEARAADGPVEKVDSMIDDKGRTRFVQRHYEAVSEIGETSGCVMLREDDLTSLMVERERREQMLRQVIDTLVAVVDRRDPYASGHSARVGQLSRAIATEMGLDRVMSETAEIAGSLMNFGKVLVSRSILTKTTALTAEELQRVRDSILTSADILSIIGFEGPVVGTLRQVLEKVDGTGTPEGLAGDAILATARIVAVANAFVAFVSPRAHREGLPFGEALAAMMKEADKAFDRRVLVALTNYIENRPTKLDWLTVKK